MTSHKLQILAYDETPLGKLCLRKRQALNEPGTTVTEVTLNHELLMSSYCTASERALASMALEMNEGKDLNVLVGGLGLGYTTHETLLSDRVKSVEVVEFLPQVIGWLDRKLIPLAEELLSDKRLNVVEGDIYTKLAGAPDRQFDAILIDVDHSPDERLNTQNGRFYTPDGLKAVKKHLAANGVLAVWSYAENPSFEQILGDVFENIRTVPVSFQHKFFNNEEHTDWLFFAVNN